MFVKSLFFQIACMFESLYKFQDVDIYKKSSSFLEVDCTSKLSLQ